MSDETEPSQTEDAVQVAIAVGFVIAVGTADAAAQVRESIASAGVRESAIEIRDGDDDDE